MAVARGTEPSRRDLGVPWPCACSSTSCPAARAHGGNARDLDWLLVQTTSTRGPIPVARHPAAAALLRSAGRDDEASRATCVLLWHVAAAVSAIDRPGREENQWSAGVSLHPLAGSYTSGVLISMSAPGADSIRFTTNGTVPSCEVGNVYRGSFGQFRNASIQAVACKSGAAGSVTSQAYTFPSCFLHTLHQMESRKNRTLPRSLCDSTTGACQPQAQKRCWAPSALARDRANQQFTEIYGLAAFPAGDQDSQWPYAPVTAAYRQPASTFNETQGSIVGGVKKIALMWTNRCSPTAKSTVKECVGWDTKTYRVTLDGVTYSTFFTSLAKADACTLAQNIALAGGTEAQIRMPIEAAGVTMAVDSATLKAAATQLATTSQRQAWAGLSWYREYSKPAAMNSGAWAADVCYVPTAPSGPLAGLAPYVAGVMFDYEPADRRSPEQAAVFFETVVPAIKALQPHWKVAVSNDPIDRSGEMAGITPASGPRILAAVDGVEINVDAGVTASCLNRAFSVQELLDQQISLWNGNGTSTHPPAERTKFIVSVDLTNDENTSPEMRTALLHGGFTQVILHEPYIRQMSCDVSDETNALVTNPARHVKDLFNLPSPDEV